MEAQQTGHWNSQRKNYEVIVQKRRGIRMAYIECYDHIKEDIIITFSPDGNSLVETIPMLAEKIKEGYDMVIFASRYKDEAKSYDDTLITGAANFVFSLILSLLGYRHTDAMVMLRAYRRDVPDKLKLNMVRSPLYEKVHRPLCKLGAADVHKGSKNKTEGS